MAVKEVRLEKSGTVSVKAESLDTVDYRKRYAVSLLLNYSNQNENLEVVTERKLLEKDTPIKIGSLVNIPSDKDPINATLNQCISDVKEVTAWDEEQTLKAAKQVCDLREKHIAAKERFSKSLNSPGNTHVFG